MLDAIREIGIFMIAAQAVVHFAPGKHYEKYIKSVAGIIILLLFLKPVLRLAGAAWEEPQVLWKKWEEMTDMPDFAEQMQADSVTDEVVMRMESEVKELLNRELETDAYFVSRVVIRFSKEPGEKTDILVPEVEIWMGEKGGEGEKKDEQIGIEEIVVGQPQKSALEVSFSSYRIQFAALLGMEEERVEVRRDG